MNQGTPTASGLRLVGNEVASLQAVEKLPACFDKDQHERTFTCDFNTYPVRPEALEG